MTGFTTFNLVEDWTSGRLDSTQREWLQKQVGALGKKFDLQTKPFKTGITHLAFVCDRTCMRLLRDGRVFDTVRVRSKLEDMAAERLLGIIAQEVVNSPPERCRLLAGGLDGDTLREPSRPTFVAKVSGTSAFKPWMLRTSGSTWRGCTEVGPWDRWQITGTFGHHHPSGRLAPSSRRA